MPKPFSPKVVTANALLEGDVVYLTAGDEWTRHLHEAELLQDEAQASQRLLDAEMRPLEVVGPYLADARASDAGPRPVHFREEFRAAGPSNYNHGKQEEHA
ncbi:hypothetical protein AIOL_001651 [Candidatus Rhodobacter oscarellae]|uniref:Sulfite reductase n=1 Tax=Candidatus Rhodobacter oscarellae TaxID=1675527 RepID=A0A0J9E1D7_9RHOB|nr:DUF2849 domain-containing protein [Candidatus Rhodobacter lobularis]KMW56696.1 hypothetical protein AIOL_001651 [Candidatus Rhodobacter lobularis]